jgi:hypothetical protein
MPNVDAVYIDLAVGLAVAFFLLSLAPSALNEAVAFVTRIRSKFLWAYLNQQFTAKDAAQPEGTAAKEATFAVEPTAPGAQHVTQPAAAGKASAAALPSSPRGVFRLMRADATTDPRPDAADVVSDETPFVDRLHRQLRPIDIGSSIPGKNKTTVKYIPASFAQALLEVFKAADPASPDKVTTELEKLQQTPIYPTLKALWATSENSPARFREQLERWFDSEMARLSGLYKRATRWILAIAAVVVALVVNVDPIALGRDLWRDPARRASLVELADAAATDDGGETDPELTVLFDRCRDESGGEEPTPEQAAERFEAVRTCVVDALEAQRRLGLLNDSVFEWDRFEASWRDGWQWLLRPVKLGLVAVAIFFGAPFWYDVLRRLMGIRRPPARPET